MSRAKQIEEHYDLTDIIYMSGYGLHRGDCYDIANQIQQQGYRKQSEGEWIFHKDGSATCNQCNTTQKHIWDMDNFQSYCGHCGAKMKGGAK